MPDNPKRLHWIKTIQQNLDQLLTHDPDVFVAGDLFWYPVEGNDDIHQIPSVMVVFGRPKSDRNAYQQWKEKKIAPQVVFEIPSPSDGFQLDRGRKLMFYNRFGVEEYYLYDPEANELAGWCRTKGYLETIEPIHNWVSPRLGIRFDASGNELQIFRPDGEPFSMH
jgi:Uma2 family endonuclease